MPAEDALVAFGSNQGNSRKIFDDACCQIAQLPDVDLISTADLIQTPAITGKSSQGDPGYFNSVVRLKTDLAADVLMQRLLEIELEMGRIRQLRWGPRGIDLDLLMVGQQIIQTEALVLPHPRMSYRRFVLEPACQVAGDLVHPVCGCSLSNLLQCINASERQVGWLCQETGALEQNSKAVFERIEKICRTKKIFLKPDFFSDSIVKASDLGGANGNSKPMVESPARFLESVTTTWSQLKLLVVTLPVHALQWTEVGNRFRGPTLFLNVSADGAELNAKFVDDCVQEFQAAIDAMRRFA